jgi:hypothetical protein
MADIVIRFLEVARETVPDINTAELEIIERRLRAEFGGDEVYVAKRLSVASTIRQQARAANVSERTIYRRKKRTR